MFALRDPLGIADEMIVVSRTALFVMQFMDGCRNIEELTSSAYIAGQAQVEKRMIQELVSRLDELFFLDNQSFQRKKSSLEEALLNAEVREARHAGVSYPDNRDDLHKRLNSFFNAQNGAGKPDDSKKKLSTPAAVVAPHIDLRIGGAAYTHAWRRIAESEPADVYVILGTGHAGLKDVFSVLPVDFETPLGVTPVDKKFIANLQKNYDFELFNDAFLHGTEHTIEFQTVFLRHAFPQRKVKIVPILCSFSFQALTFSEFSREKELIAAFAEALQKTIRDYEGTVTLVASVDLSHVGPRYGDQHTIDHNFLAEVERHDRAALEHISQVDAEGWLKTNAETKDRYRICGFSPVYTMLQVCNAGRGEILKYEQGKMDDGVSHVSYCSAVLEN